MCHENTPTSLLITISSICSEHSEVGTTWCMDQHFLCTANLLTERKQSLPITRSGLSLALLGMARSCLAQQGTLYQIVRCGGFTLGQSIHHQHRSARCDLLLTVSPLLPVYVIEFIFLCHPCHSLSSLPPFRSYFFVHYPWYHNFPLVDFLIVKILPGGLARWPRG